MSAVVSTSEMLQVVARWAGTLYPHLTPNKLCVYFPGLAEPVSLPMIPLPLMAAPEAQADDGRDKGRGLSRCPLDVLKVLRAAGKPLTLTRLLEEMGLAGLEWSKSSVENYCAEMVRDGTLLNPDDARPRGYRLPG